MSVSREACVIGERLVCISHVTICSDPLRPFGNAEIDDCAVRQNNRMNQQREKLDVPIHVYNYVIGVMKILASFLFIES